MWLIIPYCLVLVNIRTHPRLLLTMPAAAPPLSWLLTYWTLWISLGNRRPGVATVFVVPRSAAVQFPRLLFWITQKHVVFSFLLCTSVLSVLSLTLRVFLSLNHVDACSPWVRPSRLDFLSSVFLLQAAAEIYGRFLYYGSIIICIASIKTHSL